MFSLKFKLLFSDLLNLNAEITVPNSALRYENLPELSPVTNIAIVGWKYRIPFFISQHQATLSQFLGSPPNFAFLLSENKEID